MESQELWNLTGIVLLVIFLTKTVAKQEDVNDVTFPETTSVEYTTNDASTRFTTTNDKLLTNNHSTATSALTSTPAMNLTSNDSTTERVTPLTTDMWSNSSSNISTSGSSVIPTLMQTTPKTLITAFTAYQTTDVAVPTTDVTTDMKGETSTTPSTTASTANVLTTQWLNPLTTSTTLKQISTTSPNHLPTTLEGSTTEGVVTTSELTSKPETTESASSTFSNPAKEQTSPTTKTFITTSDVTTYIGKATTEEEMITSRPTTRTTDNPSTMPSKMSIWTTDRLTSTQSVTQSTAITTEKLATSILTQKGPTTDGATSKMTTTPLKSLTTTQESTPTDGWTTSGVTGTTRAETSKTPKVTHPTSDTTNTEDTTNNITNPTLHLTTQTTGSPNTTSRVTINSTTRKTSTTNDSTTSEIATLTTSPITSPSIITQLTNISTPATQNATDKPTTRRVTTSVTTDMATASTATATEKQASDRETTSVPEQTTVVQTSSTGSPTTSISGATSTPMDFSTEVMTSIWTSVVTVTSLLPIPEVDIFCPDDIIQPTDPGSPFAVVTWPDVIANDTTGYLNVTSNYTSGDLFPIGITKVTYVVVDDDVKGASCSFNVTILDLERPRLKCPPDVIAYADGEDRVPVNWMPPTVRDNSGLEVRVYSTHDPGDDFFVGNTIVRYVAIDVYDNKALCSFQVIIIARCPEDQTDSDLGILTWPVTVVDSIAESDQRCPIDTNNRGYGLATRPCRFDDEAKVARWEPYVIQECGEPDKVELGDLPDTPVVEDNVEEVADALEELTKDNANLTPDDISDVAETLENIVDVASPSIEVTTSVVVTIDNILAAEESSLSDSANTTSSIVISLETQVAVTLESEGAVKVVESTLAVDGLTVNEDDLFGALTFAVLDDGKSNLNENKVATFSNINEVPEEVETKIELPTGIFSSIMSGENGTSQVIFTIYQDDSLFNSQQTKWENFTVAGAVVSAEVLSSIPEYFNESVMIDFLPIQMREIDDVLLNTSVCVFWDFQLDEGSGDWSSEGCQFVGIQNGRVMCECNHLTNFAVIINLTGHDLSDKQEFALTVITYIGCALSMLGLTITLSIFLGFRKLRIGPRKRARRILIHFCFSLLFLYLVFVFGIDLAVGSAIGCTVVAGLIQYFTLTSMVWMAIEARQLYSKLVRIFDEEKDWFMTAATVIGWGGPLVVVSVTIGVALLYVGEYVSNKYCFIPPGPVLYYGVALPIGLILLHNFVTFAFVMHSLFKRRMENAASFKTVESQRKEIKKRLFNTLCISVLMGLTWVLGFLAIEEASFTFQLLFCLCNSFQGTLIFILFCLRAPDVQDIIMPYFQWVKIPDPLNLKSRTYAVRKMEEQQGRSESISTSEVPVSLSTFNLSLQLSESVNETNDLDRVVSDLHSQALPSAEDTETQFGHVNQIEMNVPERD